MPDTRRADRRLVFEDVTPASAAPTIGKETVMHTDCECAICQGGQARDDYIADIEAQITRHGWFAQGVISGDTQPAFVYSVGFHHIRRHPEVIVVGLPMRVAQELLWVVYRRIQAGEDFTAGSRAWEIIKSYPVVFRAVPLPRGPLHMARNYWRRDFPVLQLVWPDLEGHFPDDVDYDERLVQPNAELLK